VADWQARLRRPGPWADRFTRLVDAIANADDPASAYNCVDLGPMLEAYVDDALHGRDVAARHNPLRDHLRTCSVCQSEVEWLIDAGLTASRQTDKLQAPIADLPFLRPSSSAPWSIQPRSQLQRPGRGLLVRFLPAFVAGRYQRPSLLTLRSAGPQTEDLVLMSEQIESDSHTWLMQVKGARLSSGTDRMTVCVDLQGESTDHLRITLHWGEHTYAQNADPAGHACFDDLPADVVQLPSPSIQIEVQVVDPTVPS
jgi:hypothetical protein